MQCKLVTLSLGFIVFFALCLVEGKVTYSEHGRGCWGKWVCLEERTRLTKYPAVEYIYIYI